ncbi:MAG TPA: efflux RND transporter periplasmic adaptor subunit [Rhodopila sp.]|jgi:multidrug efflux system membrane fusion protein|nr:efflux RND transporter periplasmic adaptor subunit [Rhodopila sp.]
MTMKRGVGLVVPAVLLGAVLVWRMAGPAAAADPAPSPSVPVTTASAQVQDVPEFLDGLGTVQALNVVQIKAQVNGTLIALPVQQGHEVHKDEIVAQIDPRPYKAALDQAMAQRDEDTALLQSATLDLRRYADLAKRSFAPVQQVDDQKATVAKDTAAVALDNAMVETAQINLGYCTIRSPIDGRLSFYLINVGNVIQTSSQSTGIVSITQDKPISVVLTLPEADLVRVQQARTKGPVPVMAFNSQDASNALATGTLLTPDNTIDTATGTIALKATFANADDHLWPGQFVNTRVQVGVLPKVVTVPLLAVQHGPDGLFVYTVKPDKTVDQANVEVGYQDADLAVITKGLSGNETVVVAGQSRLAPGVRVQATGQPAAAQASAGGASPT